jgi:hypothetical protein
VLSVDLDRPLDEILGTVVAAALEMEGGNRTRASERLGISVRTVQRYLGRGVPRFDLARTAADRRR